MEGEIINKIAQSGLVQIDLDDFGTKDEIISFDLKYNLYEELILKEKDFREFISNNDWSIYRGKYVAVHCSSGAIVPNWAYMLVATNLNAVGAQSFFGTVQEVAEKIMIQNLERFDLSEIQDKKVLVKGCGSFEASPEVYMTVTRIFQPHVQSLMFGEACSTVPVYKRK